MHAVVGDGLCEKIYFTQLKNVEEINDFLIKPDLPSNKSKGGLFMKVFNKAHDLLDAGTDFVYCIIDFDTIIKENKQSDYSREKKRIEATGKAIVYECNPCFELWFLLHHNNVAQNFTSCSQVETEVKKYISDYSKSEDYYTRKKIYSFLKPNLEKKAYPNAALLEKNRDEKGERYPRSEVYKLLQKLGIIQDFKNKK